MKSGRNVWPREYGYYGEGREDGRDEEMLGEDFSRWVRLYEKRFRRGAIVDKGLKVFRY